MQVIIASISGHTECDVLCGEDWSSEDVLDLANQHIKQRFGESVELGYVDISKSNTRFSRTLKERVITEKLNLPLLIIDDELVISGQFDIRQLLDAIDAKSEIIS